MDTGDAYRLTFTTDAESVDRAYRARTSALRGPRRRVRAGVTLIAAGVLLFAVGVWLDGTVGLNDVVVLASCIALGVVMATGRWTSYVRRGQWKRNPAWARELTCTASESALSIQAEGIETRYSWTVVAPVIDLGDMLVLGVKGQPTAHYLPRTATADEGEWAGLVRLTRSQTLQPSATTSD